jgi:CBS domain-containing protein
MLLVKHIMVENVVTANSNITVKRAIETLYEKHIGSIVVVDDDEKCVGIFTERDVIRVVAKNAQLSQPIDKVMTKNVVTIQEETSLDEARRLIVTHRIRHLPVVNQENKLVGLLSVRWFLDQFFGLSSTKC